MQNDAVSPHGGGSSDHRSFRHPNRQWSLQVPYNNRRPPSPNFVIELINSSGRRPPRSEIESLRFRLKYKPDKYFVYDKGAAVARFFYQRWRDVLEAFAGLWEDRWDGFHLLNPRLIRNVIVPSDFEELSSRMNSLFVERVRRLLEGDLVNKWRRRVDLLNADIGNVECLLRKRNKFVVYTELTKKVQGLVSEKGLVLKRIAEFKSGMECLLDYLLGKVTDEDPEEVKVLRLGGGEFDWEKIHCLVLRECRRFDDGLPIYGSRLEILRMVHRQQVMVLIGETGSGKSTQLVQFLADSGVAGNKSIVCTQPRKLAALSLARRVREETCGCYTDSSVIYSPFYSSDLQFESRLIYMTDHCLLQHYMSDENLSKISCIIVDEAHERSVNTDILLALIKKLLHQRIDLRLVIMSATADADKFSSYFFDCDTFHVTGRTFPVDIIYAPCASISSSWSNGVPQYVSDVVRKVTDIHRIEKEGTILAFLTSQVEVEWACEHFQAPSAVALPLHGKLSHEDQLRVYLTFPGKRKIIFATNLAETSLTIPGVKYVVDCGLAKENWFEPATGMNVLRVRLISQSSANQRAGRAGRTEPGKCFRLFSEEDFRSMELHQEAEIRRVHLGVAILRIFALGIKIIQNFNFIDAPDKTAIDMAIRNLIQLQAVAVKNGVHELTKDGRNLVKLGMEPRLGKIILKCFDQRLGREGLVLAAVMANSSSIFCRVGNEEDKKKSDRLKVHFCHHDGDLFTLLSVYKEWDGVSHDKRNKWCWDNRINAKSMRRCHETVQELESCLQHELNIIVPSYWSWDPNLSTDHDKVLKKVILSSLSENVAMYSGYDQLGYEVALTGKHVQLHPSCSLLMFSEKPTWVVFGEILAITNQYLVCVNAIDVESLHTLCPPPLFDIIEIDKRRLEKRLLTGFGSVLLKKFCGKFNNGLTRLVSRIKAACKDDLINVVVNVDQNEVVLFASSQQIEKVVGLVNDALERERKWLQNECMEKCLYHVGRGGIIPSVALLGAGAEIKHLELEKRCLTVDVYLSDVHIVDDKELLMFLEEKTSGVICSVSKFSGSGQDKENEKWGRITFLTSLEAEEAAKLNPVDFMGASLRVSPSSTTYGGDNRCSSFPAVNVRISWPRRQSIGKAVVMCETVDLLSLFHDLSRLMIQGKYLACEAGTDRIVLKGIDKELQEDEIFDIIRTATNKKILDFFLLRGQAVENPSSSACEEALLKELTPFMPKKNSPGASVHVKVFSPEPRDFFMKAVITFDGSLHLEAAKALEQIEGKVLPGCFAWQKIGCQHLFHSSLSCPAPAYPVIKDQLDSLIRSLRCRKGVECSLDRNGSGSYRVKISANATKTVAELRRPLEQLMNGRTIYHASLTIPVVQNFLSREGFVLQKSIQHETRTFILFDKPSFTLRIFGPPDKIDIAEKRLVQSLLALHDSKQLEVNLRGREMPPDAMKKVVELFGPDLHGLKEMFPEAEFCLNTRRHIISIQGSKELKQKVEDKIHEIALSQPSGCPTPRVKTGENCPICLCQVEESYRLESCGHEFCRSCLIEQCESAIKSKDSFPIKCTSEGCGSLVLITDLKSLLSGEMLEELFRASLAAFVMSSGGKYRFCPSPDCPSVYKVAESGSHPTPFLCDACSVETCSRCHLEYHQFLSCEKYREFKEDPDSSLKDWCLGKDYVKCCPVCGFTIEKIDGCNHIECRCGRHICWECLEFFSSSDECYGHLRIIHGAFI